MNFLNIRTLSIFLGLLFSTTIFTSCEDEITTIGDGLVQNETFSEGKETFEVFAYNKNIEAVSANKLAVYQLGTYNDPIYGKTTGTITSQVFLPSYNPIFGNYSQDRENISATDTIIKSIAEEELIKDVYLYIPYFIKSSATNPETEEVTYILDSIYGDRTQSFRLQVKRSDYFLRDLDPSVNFESAQTYYSSQEFSPSFVSDVLFDDTVFIDDTEISIPQIDNEETTDIDESLTPRRFSPGIRVPLNSQFFQENILDKEGSESLLSKANFVTFMRGIHLSIEEDDTALMFLLDISRASVRITYSYNEKLTNETRDESDDTITRKEKDINLGLLGGNKTTGFTGNAVNSLLSESYPQIIQDALDTDENAETIYLKGGAGTFAEIQLFEAGNMENIINTIKEKNWIINKASLVFYIDRSVLDQNSVIEEPPRLYLYNAETNEVLYNIATEISSSETLRGQYLNYNGIIEEIDNKGFKYTIGITDYINNIIIRDSSNATLALTITPDITNVKAAPAILNNGAIQSIPSVSTISPLSTVLYGSNLPSDDPNYGKRPQLQISYTKAE